MSTTVNPIEFGSFLRDLRIKKGLSVRELSGLSGISNAYISLFETGKRDIPSIDILKKLNNPLGVSIEYLLDNAGYTTDIKMKYDWIEFGKAMEERGINPEQLIVLLKQIDLIMRKGDYDE